MRLAKKIASMIGIAFLLTATSSFADDCANAELLKVGPNAGVVGQTVIQIKCLSDTSWGSKGTVTLVVHPDVTDQTLATALTAMSLGKNVWVRASGKTTSEMITVMYLNK